MANAGLSSGIRWSSLSVIGREVSRSVFTIVLARLIGPEDFGIVAQATVYIGIVAILLDQGFSSALIQRKHVEPEMPGAVVTINLAVGGALTALTIAIAPLWASFMRTPQLMLVLAVLSSSLLFRSMGLAARAMLMRGMEFRKIAICDVAATMSGGLLGILVAVAGGNYWSVVVQILTTDIVYLLVLQFFGAAYRPNLHLRLLRQIAGFSLRAFAAGLLTSVSHNVDNLLVGRFHGPQALAFYAMAYKLLLLPVQLACVSVGYVLFPRFARLADDIATLGVEMTRTIRSLALLSLPAMAIVSAAAPQIVAVMFGPDWTPAVPIIQVLAIAGAVQAVYQPSTLPLILGLGHAKLNLRYAWLTTTVTIVGIVGGLPYGALGVAVGYCTATVLLVPVEWLIRRHLLMLTIRGQVACLMPAIHITAWAVAGYLSIAVLIPGHELAVLVLGTLVAIGMAVAVMRIAHRSQFAELFYMAKRVVGLGDPQENVVS